MHNEEWYDSHTHEISLEADEPSHEEDMQVVHNRIRTLWNKGTKIFPSEQAELDELIGRLQLRDRFKDTESKARETLNDVLTAENMDAKKENDAARAARIDAWFTRNRTPENLQIEETVRKTVLAKKADILPAAERQALEDTMLQRMPDDTNDSDSADAPTILGKKMVG
jgi:hypothetical protein